VEAQTSAQRRVDRRARNLRSAFDQACTARAFLSIMNGLLLESSMAGKGERAAC
jgi:hypothetical protein